MSGFIPVCMYPTTVALVDDEPRLLELLTLDIAAFSVCKTFQEPNDALKFLADNNTSQKSFTALCVSQSEESSMDERNIQVGISKVHEQVFNKERFHEVSLAIIDYAMPGMNGVELCQKLQGLRCKKMMLTGEADEQTAVDAFNDGLIDAFHRKGDADMASKLSYVVKEEIFKYFQSQSEIITKSLIDSPDHCPACLCDKAFVSYLKELIEREKISEYYLFNNDGYFLVVHENGATSWLIIKNEAEMALLEELVSYVHEEEPSEVSQKVLDGIKARESILFALDADQTNRPVDEWQDYVYPVQKEEIWGNVYYVALVKDPKTFDEKLKGITTFRDL